MKRILFILAELCLVLAFASAVRAQNHVQTITVTNSPTTITADGNYNQVLVRENAATPAAAFSITLTGTSTALNYPAGTQFLFTGNFVNGQAVGTIQATTSGPFTFIAVEASGPPSMSVKNTILNSGGSSGNATSIQGLAVSSTAPTGGVNCFETNSGDTQALWTPCGSGGTVTTFSAGNLSPLFTTSVATATSTPALTFTLSNAAADSVFGNCTGSSAAPSFCSITGAMLPSPGASSLGGIESLSATSHQWINAISTSGVPSSTQPGFSDLSGSLAIGQTPLTTSQDILYDNAGVLGRLPIIANGTCLGATAGAWASLTCSGGGLTGATTYAPLYATSATAFSSISSAGTAGQPLKSGGSGAAPSYQSDNACVATSLTDQVSTAATFATTCSIANTNIGAATVIEILMHGSYVTSATSSPKFAIQVNAGGTSGICPAPTTSIALSASVTAGGTWDAVCRIVILTTGSPGTALAGGDIYVGNGAGIQSANNGVFSNDSTCSSTCATVAYNTTTSETVSVQETATTVSGQTINLQSLIVRVIP
jgi:hypothetical protein